MTLLCLNGFKRQTTSTPVTISRMGSSRLWPIKCKEIWLMLQLLFNNCCEYADINNQEQLTICLRWVDDTLEAHEHVLGFYLIPNIASDTVVSVWSVIKDAFIRLQISLQNFRGQCYNGASNVLGKRSGVAKKIQDIQKKAHPTHCHAHSLHFS